MVTCNVLNTREYRRRYSRTKLQMIHYTADTDPLFNLQAKKILWYVLRVVEIQLQNKNYGDIYIYIEH